MSIRANSAVQSKNSIPVAGIVSSLLRRKNTTSSLFIGRRNNVLPKNPTWSCCSITKHHLPQNSRLVAHFQPGIAVDGFLNCDSLDDISRETMQKEVDKLKVIVKRELISGNIWDQLKLIDEIQRLGVAYYFKADIREAVERIHVEDHHDEGDLELYNVSLRFRILREHGYNVSSDIFYQFKDGKDHFKDCITADVLGMLSFYEAAHFRMHGEDILEEALVFTTTHLKSMKTSVSYPVAERISQALDTPLRRALERTYVIHYISIYEEITFHNKGLLKLAKLHFYLLQSLHKEEISEVTRWWKEQDIERKLPLARHRIVECYVAAVGFFPEPINSCARKMIAKMMAVATMLDDCYDAFGATIEELKIFTEAIHRWDATYCTKGLPKSLRHSYDLLLNVMNGIEYELEKQGVSHRVNYAKRILKDQARNYLVEAQWLHEGCIPSLEEYMHLRLQSVGACMTIVLSLLGVDDNITKETFEWILKYPKIIRASGLHFRLMDDLAANKFEKEIGDVASSIECYMKQHGVSEQETIEAFDQQVADTWLDINEEFLTGPTDVPKIVLMCTLNFTRIVDLHYKRGIDDYKNTGKVAEDNVDACFGAVSLPIEY